MFSSVKSKNKIYCIEASAATYSLLQKVKEHIITVLSKQAKKGDSSKFNIICFNSDVAKWCVSLVPCTNEHVSVAEEWLRHIQSMGTCNFVGAIISALREPIVNSICAVVTQEPDESIDEILDMFSYIGRKTQVHIRLCLLGADITEEIQGAIDIYTQIAESTNGSFAILKFNSDNEIVVIKDLENMMTSVVSSSSEDFSIGSHVRTTNAPLVRLLPGTYVDQFNGEPYPMCEYNYGNPQYQPFDFWKRISASQSYLECMNHLCETNVSNIKNNTVSSLAASLIVGRKVLARKYSDGQYYIGTVKEQIDTDLFTVVLGPYNTPSSEYIATDYQNSKLLDLIDLDDAWKRSIMPGDRVLAPDPSSFREGKTPFRYLTGTVLDGFIFRDYTPKKSVEKSITKALDKETKKGNSKTLVIEFTNPINKTERVNCDHAIYIPEPFFQRLCLEGTMPKAGRENLYKVQNYPENSMPGYPTSGSKKVPKDYIFTQMNVLKGRTLQVDYLMPPFSLPIYPVIDILEKEDRTRGMVTKNTWISSTMIRRTNEATCKEDMQVPNSVYTVKELAMKVADQLDKYKIMGPFKSNSDNAFYNKSPIKAVNNEDLVAKQPIHKRDHVASTNSKYIMDSSFLPSDFKDDNTQGRDSKIKRILSRNFSIHDKYYDELEKIRETGPATLDESMSYTTDKDKSISLESKLIFNGKFESLMKSSSNGSNMVPITDIGANDKIKEINDNNKLQQRRRQVEKRLQMEKERFCTEERKRDFADEYRRVSFNNRVNQINNNHRKDEEIIEKTQAMKREVVADVDNKVETSPSCQIKPETLEEIDRKRIDLMRQRREKRDHVNEIRNEDALKYIEKLEETKRGRCDARWWAAQKQMMKEYPEKT